MDKCNKPVLMITIHIDKKPQILHKKFKAVCKFINKNVTKLICQKGQSPTINGLPNTNQTFHYDSQEFPQIFTDK